MEDDRLIAQQARRIAELEEKLAKAENVWNNIHMEIYGIGGPLNDNKLEYNKEQKIPFRRIANLIGRID